MKYLKKYIEKQEYVSDVASGSEKHSIANVSLIENGDIVEYDDIVIDESKNPILWNILKDKKWNKNTKEGITNQELALITSDEFNSLNVTNKNVSEIWKDLTEFDDFKYFTGVEDINASNKNEAGNRVGGFNGAQNLESITLPSSLKTIGDFAFNMYAFDKGDSKTKLKIVRGGENVEKIGNFVFQKCHLLEEFNFGKNLKQIGRSAFNRCYSLKEAQLPNHYIKFNEFVFFKNYNLIKAILPDDTDIIPDSMFGDCTNLTNIGNLHKVKEIGNNSFDGTSASIPTNRLGNYTGMLNYDGSFDGNMPELESIGDWAFQAQIYLKDLYMQKLKVLGYGALIKCKGIERLTTSNTLRIVPRALEGTNVHYINDVYYEKIPNDCIIEDGKILPIKEITEYTFKKENEYIPPSFFYGASNISSVILEDGLTEIRFRAFQECKKLKEINIPNSVKKFSNNVFYKCESLERLNGSNSFIGKESTNIAYTFSYCKSIQELDLSGCDFSNVEQLGSDKVKDKDGFVGNCTSLTTLKLGKFDLSSLKEGMYYNTFYNCTALKDIYLSSDSKSLEWLQKQLIADNIASNVTIHLGDELYKYDGNKWNKA